MLGDIEEDALGAVELDLEAAYSVRALVHVVFAAQALELLGNLVDVLDQDAEMMQAGIVEALADLVGLEPKDRQVDRPVAQMVAVGERSVALADLSEIKRLLVKLSHRVGIFGGDGDVTKLGHFELRFLRIIPPPLCPGLATARPPPSHARRCRRARARGHRTSSRNSRLG